MYIPSTMTSSKSSMKTVVAALIVEYGTVLIAKKKKGKSLEGHWEFPGGKIEAGEDPRAALAREIQEELGVKIEPGDVLTEVVHDYGDKTIKLIGIFAECKGKFFRLADHDEIRMVRFIDLMNYKLAPADIPIAQALIEKFKIT